MSRTTRCFAFALLLTVLAGNAVQAASWHRPSSSISERGMFSAVWNWLAHLVQSTPTSQTKEGCGMDPDGRCASSMTPDEGCGMDPNGAPRACSGLIEEGGMMDPDG